MTTKILGKNVRRIDALAKVTGEALYPGDLEMEGMLHLKIVFSERAHARAKTINTDAAEAVSGVVGVFTAKDVPVNEYGLIFPDQPVLCGPGSDKPGADIVRTTMDNVAFIIAETEAAAAAAAKLIEVDYEDLPTVFDPFEAMEPDAPQLHLDSEKNIIKDYHIRKGDMDEGWAQSDVIIEGTYITTWQEHAFLQPEAGLAYLDDEGRITVEVAGQWTHEDQEQIAHALGLPSEKVRVIYPAIGGAFGGREDMSLQILLALAVMKLKRPVHAIWSREESMVGHHKRHPITIKTKWGATKDGKLTAAECLVVGDGGAYNYTSNKVLGNATLMCTGPYAIPHVLVDTYAVYTNNIPSGAFRGFGGPQAAFAAEGQINKLADALGLDPVEIRARNVLREGDLMTVNSPLPKGVSLPEVIESCATESGCWEKPDKAWIRKELDSPAADSPHLRRGVGFGAAFKNVGFSFGFPENCHAIIEIHGDSEIERVVLHHAAADVGQGGHTALKQMTAEATGVSLDMVELIVSDTATSGSSGSASASRLTFMSGNSIYGAAELAKKAWANEERPAIAENTYRPPATTMPDHVTGESVPNFAYGYVAESVEVEVDLETGQLRVLNVVCANDVGKAINPQIIEGQIEGSVVQAHGYAVMEDFQMKDGHVVTSLLSNYLIPTIWDIPEKVKSVILEYPDPIGPWGARGMAEMPFLPYAPALAAAIHDATGVWFDELPLTPERLVEGFRAAGLGG